MLRPRVIGPLLIDALIFTIVVQTSWFGGAMDALALGFLLLLLPWLPAIRRTATQKIVALSDRTHLLMQGIATANGFTFVADSDYSEEPLPICSSFGTRGTYRDFLVGEVGGIQFKSFVYQYDSRIPMPGSGTVPEFIFQFEVPEDAIHVVARSRFLRPFIIRPFDGVGDPWKPKDCAVLPLDGPIDRHYVCYSNSDVASRLFVPELVSLLRKTQLTFEINNSRLFIYFAWDVSSQHEFSERLSQSVAIRNVMLSK